MIEPYARTDPERLCLLYLVQAADEAEKAIDDAARWFIALPSIHLALGSALVVLLRGSAGIGVYKEKVRKRYLTWFDDPEASTPPNPWVEETRSLLLRAQDANEPDLFGRPLRLTAEQSADLERLASYRNDIEHVKPGAWSLQTGGLPRIMGAAAEALGQILDNHGIGFHLDPEEHVDAEQAIKRLRMLHARYRSVPPPADVTGD